MSESQRRRVTYTQLLHLWEFLNKHREIAVGFNKSAQARQHSKKMWEKIASQLNSTGEGSIKSGPEWSKYWVDYKAKLKRKNRLINEAARRTGGGPPTDLELSEVDRKFLSILGVDLGLGLPGVQVDPFPDSDVRTSQSTSDEGPLYMEVVFSENENQQPESDSTQASVSTSAHQGASTSAHQGASTSAHQGASTSAHQGASTSAHQGASTSAHQGASTSAHQGASTSAHQRASTSAQQVSSNAEQQPSVSQASQSISASQASTQQEQQVPAAATRRRRQRRPRITAADAREQLVAAAQSRAEAELANSRSIQQAVGVLADMVSILRRMEARLHGVAPTNE